MGASSLALVVLFTGAGFAGPSGPHARLEFSCLC